MASFRRWIAYLINIKLGREADIGAAWPRCRFIDRTPRKSSQTGSSPQPQMRSITVPDLSSRPNLRPSRIALR